MASAAAAAVTFERHEIVPASTRPHTVLTGFLLGGETAEVALVHVDGNDDRRLQIYAFEDNAWKTIHDATLSRGTRFVDVGRIGGRDRLITYQAGRLAWFDPDTARERTLVEVTTSFRARHEASIPRVDVTRDLNGDGRDDLVLPDLDGFWIATQATDGSFGEPVKLGPREPFLEAVSQENERVSYREVGVTDLTIHWYLSRLHQLDYDRDGRDDLVFWNEDHFDVYRQDESGRFEPTPRSFSVEVPFDAEAYSIAFAYSGKSVPSLLLGLGEKRRLKLLHSFRDLNGDSVADLVTFSFEGRSPTRGLSRFEVHFGTPMVGRTEFSPDVGMAIEPRTRALGMLPWGYSTQLWRDLDGDGRIDLMFGQVKMTVGGMMRAMVAKSIALDLEIYRSGDGVYPDRPTTRRKVRPDRHLFGRKGPFFPAVLVGDVNGDGRADLLTGKNWNELQIFLGVPGPELLAREPLTIEVGMPGDERNCFLADLDRDDSQDLVVYQGPRAAPHRLTTLFARSEVSSSPGADRGNADASGR